MIRISVYPSPLGRLTIGEDGGFLVGIWMEGQSHFPAALPAPGAETPLTEAVRGWLDAYFAGLRPDPRELPLKPEGSEFQKRVWACLLEIPYGQMRTYGEIARAVGCRSARAVGGAVGRNPISIVIPCHRVTGAGGVLTGYAGGLNRKRFLLELEASKSE